MKTMRKMTLSWSLVSVPVSVYKATEPADTSMHQHHGADGGRIKMRRFCAACDAEVPYSDIVKGVEGAGETTILFSDSDLDSLPLASSKNIAISEFVPPDDIDPALVSGDHFYLGPNGQDKSYTLLAEALATSGKVAVAKVSLSRRERIALVSVHDGVLRMDTLLWPDEVRNPGEVALRSAPEVTDDEMDLALKLIDALSSRFNPDDFRDEYTDAFAAMVERKRSDPDAPAPELVKDEPQAQPSMSDALTAALKATGKTKRKAS